MNVIPRTFSILPIVAAITLAYGILLGCFYILFVHLAVPNHIDIIFLSVTIAVFGVFPCFLGSLGAAILLTKSKKIPFGTLPLLALVGLIGQFFFLKYLLGWSGSGNIVSSVTMQQLAGQILNVALVSGVISQSAINRIWPQASL